MPAKSQAQQRLFAIAEKYPGKLHPENRGVLKIGKQKMAEFARTKQSGLPMRKGGK